jgi:hypothetical protein
VIHLNSCLNEWSELEWNCVSLVPFFSIFNQLSCLSASVYRNSRIGANLELNTEIYLLLELHSIEQQNE